MARYQHLTFEERRTVYHMIQARRPVREVAALLGRHSSTIYRELDRNWHHDEHPPFRGYFHTVAQDKARKRRTRGGKIARCGELGGYIADRLAAAWSPEQISGHLRRQPGGPSVCHETIYQYVYGAHGRSQDLWRLLPCARRSRRVRYGRKPRGFRIPVENTIAARPPEIAERGSFGHWEGDLIAFRQAHGKANLTSLVERRSRYAVLLRNPSRHSTGVMAGIDRRLRALPASLRRSLTLDRGTDFARYRRLK